MRQITHKQNWYAILKIAYVSAAARLVNGMLIVDCQLVMGHYIDVVDNIVSCTCKLSVSSVSISKMFIYMHYCASMHV